MKYLALLATLLALQNCTSSGVNSKISINKTNGFVEVNGVDLEGAMRQLPAAFEGKVNVVAISFKREQQNDIDTWIPDIEKLMEKNRNLHFYEVSVMSERGSFSRSLYNNSIKSRVKKSARTRVVAVYTDREKFFYLMKMKEDRAYILLLDKSGKVLWRNEGKSSEKKIKFLQSAIQKAKYRQESH